MVGYISHHSVLGTGRVVVRGQDFGVGVHRGGEWLGVLKAESLNDGVDVQSLR